MPYYRKRRTYKKKPGRVQIYGAAGKQLYKDVMYLKGLINSEPMSHRVESSANYDYNGTVFDLSAISQGDQEGQRTGNKILPRYLNLYVHINQIATTAPATHCTHRMVLFKCWTEAGATIPLVTDILTATAVGTQYAPLAHLTEQFTGGKGDRSRRIEVLRNEFVTLDTVSKTAVDFHYNIVMNGGNKKEHIEYQGNVTAPAISGGIYLLVVSSNPTATDSGIWLGSNLTFYDN